MGRTRRKKRKTHVEDTPDETTVDKKPPCTFVIGKDGLGKVQQQLVADFRKVMEPLTATRLKVRKSNSVKDFLHVAGPLGVTQMISFSATTRGTYMRLARLPHGPTLTFRVQSYTLSRQVLKLQRRPISPSVLDYLQSPLVVKSNFKAPAVGQPGAVAGGSTHHVQLMSAMIGNLFPPLDVQNVSLKTCRRVVLANYDAASDKVEWRHYTVTSRTLGVSRGVQQLVNTRAMPDLSSLSDISELAQSGGMLGEGASRARAVEDEDGSPATVAAAAEQGSRGQQRRLAKKLAALGADQEADGEGAGEGGTQQRALRLRELGPRLSLQLIKVEKGFFDGEVLYHRFVRKTPEQVAAHKAARAKAATLKAFRKKEQEENVKRKEATKRKKRRRGHLEHTAAVDDDAQYYRDEVGEEPEDASNSQTGTYKHGAWPKAEDNGGGKPGGAGRAGGGSWRAGRAGKGKGRGRGGA